MNCLLWQVVLRDVSFVILDVLCGTRFHTIDRKMNRRTHNNGVMVEGSHRDQNIDFYGVLLI